MHEIREILEENDRKLLDAFLESFYKNIRDKYDLEGELNVLIEKKDYLPASVFTKELGILESITKYLHQKGLSNKEISEMLDRSPSNIAVSYKNAQNKLPEQLKEDSKVKIPLNIFTSKLTCFESICLYLVDQGMRYSEVAKLLDRDQRTIWTIYHRAKEKNEN